MGCFGPGKRLGMYFSLDMLMEMGVNKPDGVTESISMPSSMASCAPVG